MPTLHGIATLREGPEPPPAASVAAFSLGYLAAIPAAVLAAVLIVWIATTLMLWAGVMG